jgi:PBP1b-binding outer membrane lipoprotein LpoB
MSTGNPRLKRIKKRMKQTLLMVVCAGLLFSACTTPNKVVEKQEIGTQETEENKYEDLIKEAETLLENIEKSKRN